MIFPKVKLGASVISGTGLFADENIKKNTKIHKLDSKEYVKIPVKKLFRMSQKKREKHLHFGYQGSRNYFFDFSGSNPSTSFWINHSCDPNCWYKNDRTVVAKRNIKKDEELTLDYATIMDPDGPESDIECNCGSRLCRKIIKKTDCLNPKIRKKYNHHFLRFIENKTRLVLN